MLAGEESGGIAVETHIPERDGIWMGLILMEFMALTGKSLSALIDEVYGIVGSFVFKRNDLSLPQATKEAVVNLCAEGKIDRIGKRAVGRVEDMDGYKFILDPDTWVMIRPSGTEPVLRIYVEAANNQIADEILRDVNTMIDRI